MKRPARVASDISTSSTTSYMLNRTAEQAGDRATLDRTHERTSDRSHERSLDRIDLNILTILQREGRMTNQALSERVHLSARACLDRVRKLEQSGIITGYMATLDPQRLGRFVTVIALVTLKDQGASTQRRFEQLMRECQEVIACYLVSGEHDYCVRLACQDLEHYRTLTAQWIDDPALNVARIVSNPELQTVKPAGGIPLVTTA